MINLHGQLCVVLETPTAGLVDGGQWAPSAPYAVLDTTTYPTAAGGSNMAFVLAPVTR